MAEVGAIPHGPRGGIALRAGGGCQAGGAGVGAVGQWAMKGV